MEARALRFFAAADSLTTVKRMENPTTPLQQEPRVTTVAENALRASVEPYGMLPTLDIPDGVIACHFCGNTRFRRSRVRVFDVRELLLLRYPLRCMRCNQRQYGSFLIAGLALPPKSHGSRVARGNETWKAWTEQGESTVELSRPMSTAVGTRATKLQASPRKPGTKATVTPIRKDNSQEIW